MTDLQIQQIKDLFHCQTEFCKKNVTALINESIQQIGVAQTIVYYDQWKNLSKKLNNKSKLTCLGDRNHRLMLLQFIKAEAANQYKSSYFNRAKINLEYINYLRKIGPYLFTEVITIVNKLKLIKKYYIEQVNDNYRQDHIKTKIQEIIFSDNSKKRLDNSNVHKFVKIVEFEDREGLIRELGKMLRTAWAKQKNKDQLPLLNQQTEGIKPVSKQSINIQETPKDNKSTALQMIEYLSQDFQGGNSFDGWI